MTKDVRDMSVDELMDEYDDFREQADHLPSDDPKCIEVELVWSLTHQVFGEKNVR